MVQMSYGPDVIWFSYTRLLLSYYLVILALSQSLYL